MTKNIERVRFFLDFLKLSEVQKSEHIANLEKYPKLYSQDETWAIRNYMVKDIPYEQIDSWLDELHEANNSISLPHIPYDYHHLYSELVRRESLGQ